jgi:glycosyltransferase involved in cell wall biosynthesis
MNSLLRDRMTIHDGAHLLFLANNLCFADVPWVLEIDYPWDVIGTNVRHLTKFESVIERQLASEKCRKVMFFTNFGRHVSIEGMRWEHLSDKMVVLPRAVHSKRFTRPQKRRIRILFLGSANLSGEFAIRGGWDVLDVFSRIAKYREDVELILRSDVPRKAKLEFSSTFRTGRVRLLERPLSNQQLSMLFVSSDIFLFPCHYNNWLTILEAMSFGLPVVSLGVPGADEFIADGETGYLVREHGTISSQYKGIPIPVTARKLSRKPEGGLRSDVITELETKLLKLVDNDGLRTRMGNVAKMSIDSGKHSIYHRNEVLKSVFDQSVT